jgi:hypothetical protein
MNAKKLTMAVASLMVLAAAFVLVVPSESDAAEEFKITDAYFVQGTTAFSVKVEFNQAVPEGTLYIYYGDDEKPLKVLEIAPGSTYIKTKLGATIQEGTYYVYITTPNGNDSATIVYPDPTPAEHTITILPAVGGKVTTDPSGKACFGETVSIDYTLDDNYRLKALYVNGQALEEGVYSFTMPDQDTTIQALFEQIVITCDVTFVVSDGISATKTAVVGEIFQDVPAAPAIIGAEFVGWFCEGADKAFDFATTPVTENLTVYALYGPEAPSTEQTKKFVASIAVEEDACKLVTTAYDGNVIGKGTAAIDVYMMYAGNYVFVDQVKFAIDGKDVYSVDDITEAILTIATEPGQYAVMSTITLDSGASAITNFALFEIEAQA